MLNRYFNKKDYEVLIYNEPTVCPVYDKQAPDCSKENICADILLIDIHMPVMSGIELLRQQSQRGCKLNGSNKAVISGHIDENSEKMISDLGCSYFRKPFNLDDISGWVRESEQRVDITVPLGTI
jgi:DNA-binding response OmpR family regulator